MSIPNCQQVVADLAAQYPAEWMAAHTGGPDTEKFIRRLAWVLYSTVDQRFGLNGKRGDYNTLSQDVVNWIGEGPGNDPATGQPVTVIDCIVGAGGPNPQPAWNRIETPGPGGWVRPVAVGGSSSGGSGTPPSTPPSPPAVTPADIAAIKASLDALKANLDALDAALAEILRSARSAEWDARELNAARMGGWPAASVPGAPQGPVTFPVYSGTVWGQRITLTPKG